MHDIHIVQKRCKTTERATHIAGVAIISIGSDETMSGEVKLISSASVGGVAIEKCFMDV